MDIFEPLTLPYEPEDQAREDAEYIQNQLNEEWELKHS